MSKYKTSEGVLKKQVISLFFLGLLLMIVIEVGIGWVCGDWGNIHIGWLNQALGPVLTIGGFALVIWSALTQYKVGNGTPVPKVATQKLVTQGPYSYTRNPMTLGALFLYSGIGVWMSSGVLIILIGVVFSILLTFIYIHETPELAIRFGEEYQDYRKRTPFLLPNFRRTPK
jgi:protein-S-isoprenylcysteine O-methyltransferase Ste14